jgi:hypothetical protein
MSLVDLLPPANPISRQHRHAGSNAHAGADEIGTSGDRLGASGQGQPSRRAASGRDRAAEHGRQKALEARWGSQAAAKLELARGMIREAEVKWPGLTNYLNATRLGSDPHLIQKRAARRPGRR